MPNTRPKQIVFRAELDNIVAARGVRVRYLLGEDRSALSRGGLFALVPNLIEPDVYLADPSDG